MHTHLLNHLLNDTLGDKWHSSYHLQHTSLSHLVLQSQSFTPVYVMETLCYSAGSVTAQTSP